MEYCNPLDLAYKFQHYGKAAHREAADPTLVLFKGTYYLFASMSAGFYYSNDLASWQWHENRNLDMYLYAPDARQIGDYLYFCASSKGESSTIWRTKDPLSDQFEKVSAPFDFWNPAIFSDDDGRVYLYWGSANDRPIYGTELDPATMTPIGERKSLIYGDKNSHGFERFNFPGKKKKDRPELEQTLYDIFFGSGDPFMEGPYMSKLNGRYYLQYSAPATEESIYSNGYVVGDAPLGPFTFGVNSPFSSRLSGFITAAGHGSTMEDRYGNLWHVASMASTLILNAASACFPQAWIRMVCCSAIRISPIIRWKFPKANLIPGRSSPATCCFPTASRWKRHPLRRGILPSCLWMKASRPGGQPGEAKANG